MSYDLPHMAYMAGLRADIELPGRGPTQEQERDLYRIMVPVVDHWAANAPRLNSRFTMDRDDPITSTHEAGTAIANNAIARLAAWIMGLDRWARNRWIAIVKSRTGIDLENMAPVLRSSPDLVASVAWASMLITDLNDDMRKRVRQVMIDGAARNLDRKIIGEMLQKQAKLTKRRAVLIARDQTQKIAAKLNELQQRAAGVTRYVWQHSFMPNPRDWHVRRQGLVFQWDKPPKDGHPGHAINCRCNAVALLKPQTRREAYL